MSERIKTFARWWQGYLLQGWLRNAWGAIIGSGRFVFGASLRRTLLEVEIIALLFFSGSVKNLAVPDYRLAVLTFLLGGLLATLWATLRLQRGGPGILRRSVHIIGVGLMIGLQIVVTGLIFLALNFPLSEFAVATWPIDPNNDILARAPLIIQRMVSVFFSWPDDTGPLTPPMTLGLRMLTSAGELTLVFMVVRIGVIICALPGRWLRRLTEHRLLWRLTFSHFWVVLASLALAAVCWALLIITLVSGSNTGNIPARLVGAQTAQRIAQGITDAQKTGSLLSPDELNNLLNLVKTNSVSQNPFITPVSRIEQIARSLRGETGSVDFIVITDRQGRIIASTDAQHFAVNSSFLDSQPQPDQWRTILMRAGAGESNLELLSLALRQNFIIGGAYPVRDANNTVQSIVFVRELPIAALNNALITMASVFALSVAFVFGFLAISLFSLVVAFCFGYLQARRLTRTFETLAVGADALATGHLEQRVHIAATDEIGRLANRFNTMAQRLQESQANLEQEKHIVEQALQTKRELVASVSHELRTPVSTIRAHVDWLLQTNHNQPSADAGSDSTELDRYLDIIGREAERLSTLIEDLLDLSRVEARGIAVQREIVDATLVAREVRQTLGLMAQRERKIALSLDLAPGLPPVWADQARLTQVLLNLTRNAINYTPEGGIVVISVQAADATRIAIRVADTGIGITPADLDRIFERFYRSDASRSRHTGGAGLGLAIVKVLVEAMGGTIDVESVVGEGSIFTVTLPTAVTSDHIAVPLG